MVAFFVVAIILGIFAWTRLAFLVYPTLLTLIIIFLYENSRENDLCDTSYRSCERAFRFLTDERADITQEVRERYAAIFENQMANHLLHWPNDRRGDMERFRRLYFQIIDAW